MVIAELSSVGGEMLLSSVVERLVTIDVSASATVDEDSITGIVDEASITGIVDEVSLMGIVDESVCTAVTGCVVGGSKVGRGAKVNKW